MALKLLFTDMEGTLFEKQRVQLRSGEPHHHHSLWSRLMADLGPEALEDDARTVTRWEAGEYPSYLAWCDESLQLMVRHGLRRVQFEALLESIPLNEGVEETLAAIHQRGIITAIVSGGFVEQARRAQHRLRITHAYAAVDLYWSESGTLDHWNILPSDYEGKVDFVRLLMREYGFRKDECAFIGDGQNDVFIAKEVGTSFAYQAHPQLRVVATHELEVFSELLRWI